MASAENAQGPGNAGTTDVTTKLYAFKIHGIRAHITRNQLMKALMQRKDPAEVIMRPGVGYVLFARREDYPARNIPRYGLLVEWCRISLSPMPFPDWANMKNLDVSITFVECDMQPYVQ